MSLHLGMAWGLTYLLRIAALAAGYTLDRSALLRGAMRVYK